MPFCANTIMKNIPINKSICFQMKPQEAATFYYVRDLRTVLLNNYATQTVHEGFLLHFTTHSWLYINIMTMCWASYDETGLETNLSLLVMTA